MHPHHVRPIVFALAWACAVLVACGKSADAPPAAAPPAAPAAAAAAASGPHPSAPDNLSTAPTPVTPAPAPGSGEGAAAASDLAGHGKGGAAK